MQLRAPLHQEVLVDDVLSRDCVKRNLRDSSPSRLLVDHLGIEQEIELAASLAGSLRWRQERGIEARADDGGLLGNLRASRGSRSSGRATWPGCWPGMSAAASSAGPPAGPRASTCRPRSGHGRSPRGTAGCRPRARRSGRRISPAMRSSHRRNSAASSLCPSVRASGDSRGWCG